MLEWFADAPDPDAGLLGFRKICEALGAPTGTSRRCATRARSRERLARILATSRYATDLLRARARGRQAARPAPSSTRSTATPCRPRCSPRRERHEDPTTAIGRSARSGAASCSGSPPRDLAETHRRRAGRRGAHRPDPRRPSRPRWRWRRSVAARARGRRAADPDGDRRRWAGFGGHELGYGSDADVMFVHEPVDGAEPEEAARARPGRRQRAAPAARRLRDRPRARGRRRPAARGQAGAAGAHAGVLRRLLRQVVRGVGGAGAAARRGGGRRRGPVPTLRAS